MKAMWNKFIKGFISVGLAFGFFNITLFANSTLQTCINDNVTTYQKSATELTYLNCSNMGITSLDGIDKLVNLQQLDIRNNSIERIPNSIASLKKLREINISNNNLRELPTAVWSLPTLTSFSASNNELTSLSIAPSLQMKLEKLDLSGNALQTVSQDIGNVVSLTELNLAYNFLETLPSLEKLQNLKILKVQYNNFIALPSLKENPLEVFQMEKNLLGGEEIITGKGRFFPTNQNQVGFYAESITISVFNNWMATSKILPALLVLNDGRQVQTISTYQLVDLVDEDGMSQKLSHYLDAKGNVIREGKISAYLQVFDSKGKTSEKGRSTTPLIIKFFTSYSVEPPIPPNSSTSNNEKTTDNNTDEQSETNGPSLSEDEVLPVIYPEPSVEIQQKIEEKLLAESWMFSVSLDGKAGERLSMIDHFFVFFRMNPFSTVTTIISLLLIPLFLLLLIMYFNRKMFKKNEDILKRRMKK